MGTMIDSTLQNGAIRIDVPYGVCSPLSAILHAANVIRQTNNNVLLRMHIDDH